MGEGQRRIDLRKAAMALAVQALNSSGFSDVKMMKRNKKNGITFGDLVASRGDRKFLISVETRNEDKDDGKLNDSYNVLRIEKAENNRLKDEGSTTQDITSHMHHTAREIANEHDAEPAFLALAVRPARRAYAAYFGELRSIDGRRSIPMRLEAREDHECLVNWSQDPSIHPSFSNRF